MSYLHAGGIDRPLTITKDAQEPIIPHQNWRGTFAWGTWGKGTYKGYQSDCVSGGPSTCANVAWPGWQTNAWHAGGKPGEQEYWMGSLADGMRNVNGQIYMRNRYYDPATGQFTQTDPIGLAGGLNAYGFAAGDPVTYSDPYGLTAETNDSTPAPKRHDRCAVASFLTRYVSALRANPENFTGSGIFPTEFDPKFSAPNDLFQVGDRWLRADEFGNFAAGYASYRVGGGFAWLGTRAVGIRYAAERDQHGDRISGEHWSDRESAPMINAGARLARLEMRGGGHWARPQVSASLMSEAGCLRQPTSGPDPTGED